MMELLYVKIRCLYMQLNNGASQTLCAERLYRFVLIVITDKSTILSCRLGYNSTYSRACIIQSIDTVQVDVSQTQSAFIVAIIILLASFASFPVSCNALASAPLHSFMSTVVLFASCGVQRKFFAE